MCVRKPWEGGKASSLLVPWSGVRRKCSHMCTHTPPKRAIDGDLASLMSGGRGGEEPTISAGW